MHGETSEMQVDQPEGFGTGEDGVEGEGVDGGGVGGSGLVQQKFLKVDGDVLESGLRELVPSLCAYLRGHTEVSSELGGGLWKRERDTEREDKSYRPEFTTRGSETAGRHGLRSFRVP